ncbi:putative Zinc-ribbon domain-containing protein [Burkholderia orbicola]
MRAWKSGKPSHTLEEMQALAEKQGGVCLATRYERGRDLLRWRCGKGHEWQAVGESIVAGRWCPRCAVERNSKAQRLGIEVCKEMARVHGGRCLSDEYINSKTPLMWECREGHTWSSRPDNIRQGHWCISCANERKSRNNTNRSIEQMQTLAAKKGGSCRSSVYRNVYHALEWECVIGHRWTSAPANIIAGRWCPKCALGKSERICRAVFENLFEASFPRARPKWLLGTRGASLELDGYCAPLKLAFEYQGAQHFVVVKKFKMNGRHVSVLQARDEVKRTLCREHGVTLIEIPYTVPGVNIEDHIRAALRKAEIVSDRWSKRPRLNLLGMMIVADGRLDQCQAIARERGGYCLSDQYLGQSVSLRWRCSMDHEWWMTPKACKRGGWCVDCRKFAQAEKHRAETFEKVRLHVAKLGGQLISEKFESQNEPLHIICRNGHRWSASWASLRHGTGCVECRKFGSGAVDLRHMLAAHTRA